MLGSKHRREEVLSFCQLHSIVAAASRRSRSTEQVVASRSIVAAASHRSSGSKELRRDAAASCKPLNSNLPGRLYLQFHSSIVDRVIKLDPPRMQRNLPQSLIHRLFTKWNT